MSTAFKQPHVLYLFDIMEALKNVDVIPVIEEGFVAYSKGKTVVPPVGEMIFQDPPGDVHIKYGYIINDDYYVVKVASGFYKNPALGLPSSNGLMLLFCQKTGQLLAVLLDEGYLTNLRTAAAGAIAARYLAPLDIKAAGIIGAGTQARMQLDCLSRVRTFSDVIIWGLNEVELEAFTKDMIGSQFKIRTTLSVEEVAASANLIVTCTPSTRPLLKTSWVRPGTHITAVGSDTPEKQELEAQVLAKADRVVVDSLSQAELRGEAFKAMAAGVIQKNRLIELGQIIIDPSLRRKSEEEITVADLTGLAVQDIQIARAVWESYKNIN